MFGIVPDADIDPDQTVLPYLLGAETTLAYAVRPTNFAGVSLIPACLGLYEAEMQIIVQLAGRQDPAQRAEYFSELRYGIETVAQDFDVVLIDSPPALGAISISVLLAADALLVPSAAKMFDFSSTVQFFRMIHTYIQGLAPQKTYRWISVLTTLFDQRYESQKQFVEVMRQCFGEAVFQRVFFHSSEVINSAAQFLSPYEQEKPRRDVLKMMDAVFGEVEVAILREWPSKRAQLMEQGVAA